MKTELYEMRDKLSGYTTPIPFTKKEIAMRYFKEQVKNTITVKTTPSDFEMYKVGEFDSDTGKVTMLENYELVAKGEDYAEV